MVGYCYNKYECWSSASVSDMRACRRKSNRYDFWLDATVKDMTKGRMQLLQSGGNVIYIDADMIKL